MTLIELALAPWVVNEHKRLILCVVKPLKEPNSCRSLSAFKAYYGMIRNHFVDGEHTFNLRLFISPF
jgi:hypothetical protein